MGIKELNKWADMLLDTGKRNNLMNFRESRESSAEIIAPDFVTLFKKAESASVLEAYDPKLEDDEALFTFEEDSATGQQRISRTEYLLTYQRKLRKQQVLIYNYVNRPIQALKSVYKKAKTAIEETGVNISYFAFGFVNWFEKDMPSVTMKAPLLLAPVTIENNSSIEPYYLKLSDEIIVNPTFAFKLQNEYGITIPEYDEDEGIEAYLDKIEDLFAKLKWTITRECRLGIFSFLKINMYKDLKDNSDIILKNEDILTLMGENEAPIDTTINESGLLSLENVVDADASQSEAIQMAREGKSFVLQGPPGTGKSQTITNIIAQCLADNKTVLFVSEKLAALNVVYDKLKKAELSEFCLELHSHKASKKQVIFELCHTLRLQKSDVSNRAVRELEIKKKSEEQLDEYANELHKIRPTINKSLFELYEELASCKDAPNIEVIIDDIRSKGENFERDAFEALYKYVGYIPSIGKDYHKNIWYGYINKDSSYQAIVQLKNDLQATKALSDALSDASMNVRSKYGIKLSSIEQSSSMLAFLKLAQNSEFITPALFVNVKTLDKIIENVKRMKALSRDIISAKASLDAKFEKDIYNLNGYELLNKLKKQYSGFFSRLFSSEYRKIINDLRLASINGKKPKYNQAIESLSALSTYQNNYNSFCDLELAVKEAIGKDYNGYLTDFDALLIELNAVKDLFSYGISFESIARMTNGEFDMQKPTFRKLAQEIQDAFVASSMAHERLNSYFAPECFNSHKLTLDELYERTSTCLNNIDSIDNWCEFTKLLDELESLQLKKFIDFCIDEDVDEEQIVPSYKHSFYTQWIDAIIHESPILVQLSRVPHDELVEVFAKKDELYFEINKAKIKAVLSANRPNLDMVAGGSAVALLLREGEKKRKQKGIRQLISEIGELVLALKPCFLMSPLSVSTFLNPNIKFDVVIFDEASQIFPQDAIGAIYRGKQLIVVGDSKQMPPSNFFNATTEVEDESEDFTDFESILDLCSTAFPQRRLKWHYRSRYEQLISFSNMNFYDGDLITFPSSKTDRIGIGVDYIYAEGTFDRATKTNLKEAEKVVDLVFEHAEKNPNQSLGVVAFSISQQNLIDKLISRRRRKNPEFEAFFSLDSEEPFFVKNLETVQGDERDVIIFSVGYAKDDQGKLLLNFGPLNREGGERRLNVAITRAKCNVQLVTSLKHLDIDLSKTKSLGAKMLRDYLNYAENGMSAICEEEENSFQKADIDFEREVCEFLESKGFKADLQVGCSSMKVDIAVKHPNSEDYVLAIECDGSSYRASKTTRDRERLRKEVLERMGWHYYRLWSTDWFRNKRLEKERLLAAVDYAISGDTSKPLDISKVVLPAMEKEQEDAPSTKLPSFETETKEVHFEFPKYNLLNISRLVMRHHTNKLSLIKEILEFEAPISEEWLLKRIVHLLDEKRVNSSAIDKFSKLLRSDTSGDIIRRGGFLYLKNREIPMLRVPAPGAEEIREVKHIAVEELANGLREVLKQNISVEKLSLFKLVASQLGFQRVGEAMFSHFEAALELLNDEIEFSADKIILK